MFDIIVLIITVVVDKLLLTQDHIFWEHWSYSWSPGTPFLIPPQPQSLQLLFWLGFLIFPRIYVIPHCWKTLAMPLVQSSSLLLTQRVT